MSQELMPQTFWNRLKNEYVKVWGPLLAITLVGFFLASRYIEPPYPKHIRIAAGSQDGAYYAFAERYRELLAEDGIQLEIVITAGSVQNLKMLESGQASLAFVQGGVGKASLAENLESLASLYFEPLWVFYRNDGAIREFSELIGKRLAVGSKESGTESLARQLLAENGVNEQTASILPLEGKVAARALKIGEIDVAFFVSSPLAPLIQDLLTTEEIELMSIRRHLAYEKKYRFLSSMILGEGMIDLRNNIPNRNITLLATTANLVARKDLHPALVPLLLKVAGIVHEEGGIFEDPEMFPSTKLTEFPMNRTARRYLSTGPSFLHRILPFWAASSLNRLKILIVPVVTLLVPLFKVAPPLYRWQIRRRIYRWYQVLRQVDLRVEFGNASPGFEQEIGRLKTMEKEVNTISVPLAYMEEFYNLRMHLGLLLQKIEQLKTLPSDHRDESSLQLDKHSAGK